MKYIHAFLFESVYSWDSLSVYWEVSVPLDMECLCKPTRAGPPAAQSETVSAWTPPRFLYPVSSPIKAAATTITRITLSGGEKICLRRKSCQCFNRREIRESSTLLWSRPTLASGSTGHTSFFKMESLKWLLVKLVVHVEWISFALI